MRYRKKPVEVEAQPFDGTWESVNDWLTALGYDEDGDGTDGGPACWMDGNNLVIATMEGEIPYPPGYVVIRGVQGEFYACDGAVFAETYEPVEVSL